jgi:hypothetical protein
MARLWYDVSCQQVCERAAEKVRTGKSRTCDQHLQESSPCLGSASDTIHVGLLLAVRRKSDLRRMLQHPRKFGQGEAHRRHDSGRVGGPPGELLRGGNVRSTRQMCFRDDLRMVGDGSNATVRLTVLGV